MAYRLKDSPECVKSELDLFSLPPTQTVIEKGQWVQYFPISNPADSNAPVEFNISGSGEEYLDLSQTQIHVSAKIVNSDGQFLSKDQKVGPVNLLLHSLFSQIDLSLNDRLVSSSNNTYAYRAVIETLLNHGHDSKNSQLTAEMYYKDTAGNMDNADPTAIKDGNEGLVKRSEMFQSSKTVDMFGSLHCDLFYQNRLMLNLVTLKLKLIRSKPEFCLLSPVDNADFKVNLEHVSLFIRKVKVSPGVLVGHAKALAHGSAKYPINRVMCKVYSLPQGSMSWIQDNVVIGQLPKRVVIGCVDNDAFNGTYKKSPFNFKHYNLNFLSIYVDGQPVPSKPLEPQFDQNLYIRAYHSLFLGTEKATFDQGIDVSRTEYPLGYSLFAFDISSDMCRGGHLNLIRHGNLRAEAKFQIPLINTVSIVMYLEFENVIEINQSRNIIFDFSS